MEKAISISDIRDFDCITALYKRLYFGPEFCQYLLPSTKNLAEAILFAKERGMDFTLVTPYVTDEGLSRVKELLVVLEKNGIGEVVFNDWGVLHIVKEQFESIQPIMGRLLTKQKRDPRIATLINESVSFNNKRCFEPGEQREPDISAALKSYLMETNVKTPVIRQFLKKINVYRVELDYPLQGIQLTFDTLLTHASVYIPYVYVTTTRRCPVDTEYRRIPFSTQIGKCKRECLSRTIELRSRYLPKVLYQRGNTQFYKSDQISIHELAKCGFDRVIHQPKVPG